MTLFNEIRVQIPEILRQIRLLAFVKALLSALQAVQTTLEAFIASKKYELQFNGQVIYLNHRLNDFCDSSQRRIYISDPQPSNTLPTIVTNKSESQPTLVARNKSENVATAIFYNTSELQTRFDFVVFVPTNVLNIHQNALRALVNFYKIGGKTWTFQAI
jgi:hypothetical protein